MSQRQILTGFFQGSHEPHRCPRNRKHPQPAAALFAARHLGAATGFVLLCFVAVEWQPAAIIRLFNSNDPQLVEMGSQALRTFLVMLPLVLILPSFLGLEGIWLATPIADLLAALLTGYFLQRELRLTAAGQKA